MAVMSGCEPSSARACSAPGQPQRQGVGRWDRQANRRSVCAVCPFAATKSDARFATSNAEVKGEPRLRHQPICWFKPSRMIDRRVALSKGCSILYERGQRWRGRMARQS